MDLSGFDSNAGTLQKETVTHTPICKEDLDSERIVWAFGCMRC